jgi:hypothetical protein
MNETLTIGVYAISVSCGYSLVNFFFMWFAPSTYVRFAIFFVSLVFIAAMIPILIFLSFLFLFGILLFAIILIFFYCVVCGKISFSATLLTMSMKIIRKYPSVFFFNVLSLIIQQCLSYIFSTGIVIVYSKGWSYWIYVYIIISYFWINFTISYVTYSAVSGVAVCWYFLYETEYLPAHPLPKSICNAIGPGFGPCAYAGALAGIDSAFQWIESEGQKLTCGLCCICFCIFKCISKIIICCIAVFHGMVSRYTLIYTAMYGCSVEEGIKKWTSIETNTFIEMLLNSSIVSLTFKFYAYVGMLAGGIAGICIGNFLQGKDTDINWGKVCFIGSLCRSFCLNGLFRFLHQLKL